MSLCVQVGAAGVIEAVDPQPLDTLSCSLVLLTPAELNGVWALSVSGAETIFVAAAMVLVLGFTVRAITRALSHEDHQPYEKE